MNSTNIHLQSLIEEKKWKALRLEIIDRDPIEVANIIDEASLAGQNTAILVDKGDLIPFALTAEDVGLHYAPLEAIRGGNADENATIMRKLLAGEQSAYFDTVLLNAAIGLFSQGTAQTVQEGVEMAKDSIFSGRALQKLEAVVAFSEKIKEVEIGL